MATANIVLTGAGARGEWGPMPVYSAYPREVDDVTTTGTSAQSTVTAREGDFCRICVTGNAVYCAIGADPTAAAGTGFLINDGGTLDLGGLQPGHKIALIDAV